MHSESSDTHCGSLPHSQPPVVDVDTSANSNNVSEMTHHRNNSDFFVTPSSSPPASPRLPARVGNRTPSRTAIVTQRSLQTFFSKSQKKFEDILLVENNQIPTVDFLECCRAVIPFFGKFHYASSVGVVYSSLGALGFDSNQILYTMYIHKVYAGQGFIGGGGGGVFLGGGGEHTC